MAKTTQIMVLASFLAVLGMMSFTVPTAATQQDPMINIDYVEYEGFFTLPPGAAYPNPGEWMVIRNMILNGHKVNIGGWYITDVGPDETLYDRWPSEGIVKFPKNTFIDGAELIYIAQCAGTFYENMGFWPDFEMPYSNPYGNKSEDIPDMELVKGRIWFENSNGYVGLVNDDISDQDLIDALETTPVRQLDPAYIEDEYYW